MPSPSHAASASAPPEPIHALTRDDLAAWLDGFVPYAIARADVAGAEVVVVRNGDVLYEKGFGYSDVTSRTPVDPKTTLFRPGSISKLFTWTAVMQLVEQHRLDLDTDINTYLDFRIPPVHGRPITLRDLMTHRPGFEETIKNLLVTDRAALLPLREAVSRWIPEQIFTPGEIPAYSNYGAALAGYIVERVSGEPFEDYIARHIFAPLGMKHSTFLQPLPGALAPEMSKGYVTAPGDPQPFEMTPLRPAGSMSTSGDDIARFMLAQLGLGSWHGVQILGGRSADLMHGRAYAVPPGTLAMGLGFYHEDRNGHDIVAHGGDSILFHSDLYLVLDENVGFYYTQNSLGKSDLDVRGPLFRAFMNRYFPAPATMFGAALKSARQDGATVAGYYRSSRRSDSNMLRIADLFGQLKIALNDDGTLSSDDFKDLAGNPKKFREIAPFRWREIGGPEELLPSLRDGKVVRLYANDLAPVLSLTPVPLWASAAWNLPLLIATLVMLALTVLFWPVKAILRWRYGEFFPLRGGAAVAYRLARIEALVDLLFLGGILAAFLYGQTHLELFTSSHDWVFRIIQALGVLGIIGTVAPIWNMAAGWRDAARPWWTIVTDALIVLSCLAVIWFAVSERLITWTLNY